ncbi:hypothetical protein JTB14_003161 [Gonioctena quinquepunctata]|nr:hypothetical protein JTB14_003161 [Gonioctena quinquepunctata]
MLTLCLEEDEGYRKYFMENSKKCRFWVHAAWKRRFAEGEFSTLLPHLLDDDTKFHQYFRMSMSAFNLLELEFQKNLSKHKTHILEEQSPWSLIHKRKYQTTLITQSEKNGLHDRTMDRMQVRF